MRDDREGATAGDFSRDGHGKSVDATGLEPGGKALFCVAPLDAWANDAQSSPNDAQQEVPSCATLNFRYPP
jgi:hypothetical protein